jgi:hypothetical protein
VTRPRDGTEPGCGREPDPSVRTDGGEARADGATATDDGFDEWLDAVASGEGYYLVGPEGDACLPPRRVCPATGSSDLEERPLPASGVVDTYTVIHVAPPQYADETPYVTAIASFGPVRLTGLLRTVDPADVTVGMPVQATVTEVGDGRTLAFRPA